MTSLITGTPPNFFEVIGNSLPALLREIPNDFKGHFAKLFNLLQIRIALRTISSVYQTQLGSNEIRCDWKDPVFRCAYVFLYFVKHSHLVYDSLLENRLFFDVLWALRKHQRGGTIRVCSIGGGPGSDIAGVMAFLKAINYEQDLRCSVLDYYPEWRSTWEGIQKQIPRSKIKTVDVQYLRFDMTDDRSFTRTVMDTLNDADLVTFVKSFSTVSTVSSVYTSVLPNIMKALESGTFLLFIDNTGNKTANTLFKTIAKKCGLFLLNEKVYNERLSKPAPSNVDDLSAFFDYKPLRRCRVTMYLFLKKY